MLGAIDHRLGRRHLIIGARRRRLDIDNDRVLDIDKIVETIPELNPLVGFRGPRGRWIGRRDYFRRLAIAPALRAVSPDLAIAVFP